jgi:hypothetical protein
MSMKTSVNITMKHWIALVVMSLIIINSGCSARNELQMGTMETVIVPPTTLTPMITDTLPVTNTTEPTPSPTHKSTMTSTPTMTGTPTPTATLTPPVTLEPAVAKEEVKRLFKEEVDCATACFWGIVPGETSLGEATNILKRLGISWRSIYPINSMEVYYTTAATIDSVSGPLELFIFNGLVENIRFGF